MKNIEKIIIIDGNALIYKFYFGIFKGEEYSGDILEDKTKDLLIQLKFQSQKLLNSDNYKYGLVVFDTSKKTFRTEKFKDYKSQRPPTPLVLLNNQDKIIEKFRSNGFTTMGAPLPYEADDLIGTVAKECKKIGVLVDVFTTDHDMLQLVDYGINVNILKKGTSTIYRYSHETFINLTKGLLPYQIPLQKAIGGDSSDNYKGIPGIGEKGALDIVKKYKNKENIYKNIEELSEKQKKAFKNHEEELNLFLDIATIRVEIPFDKKLSDFIIKKHLFKNKWN